MHSTTGSMPGKGSPKSGEALARGAGCLYALRVKSKIAQITYLAGAGGCGSGKRRQPAHGPSSSQLDSRGGRFLRQRPAFLKDRSEVRLVLRPALRKHVPHSLGRPP